MLSLKEQWFTFVHRLANLQHVLVPRRKNEKYQVSLEYDFTKEKFKELDWPPCGTRPPPIGVDDKMPEGDIDPLGKDAIDATKLFPDLAGNKSTAAGSSFAMKHAVIIFNVSFIC